MERTQDTCDASSAKGTTRFNADNVELRAMRNLQNHQPKDEENGNFGGNDGSFLGCLNLRSVRKTESKTVQNARKNKDKVLTSRFQECDSLTSITTEPTSEASGDTSLQETTAAPMFSEEEKHENRVMLLDHYTGRIFEILNNIDPKLAADLPTTGVPLWAHVYSQMYEILCEEDATSQQVIETQDYNNVLYQNHLNSLIATTPSPQHSMVPTGIRESRMPGTSYNVPQSGQRFMPHPRMSNSRNQQYATQSTFPGALLTETPLSTIRTSHCAQNVNIPPPGTHGLQQFANLAASQLPHHSLSMMPMQHHQMPCLPTPRPQRSPGYMSTSQRNENRYTFRAKHDAIWSQGIPKPDQPFHEVSVSRYTNCIYPIPKDIVQSPGTISPRNTVVPDALMPPIENVNLLGNVQNNKIPSREL